MLGSCLDYESVDTNLPKTLCNCQKSLQNVGGIVLARVIGTHGNDYSRSS